jgi:multiple sugar transport system permease protein
MSVRFVVRRTPALSYHRLLRALGLGLTYLTLIAGGVLSAFPFYWMVSSSLKQNWEILQFPPTLVPVGLTFEHYGRVLATTGLPRAFVNSVIVTSCQVILVVIISTMVGYALAKLRFPGRQVLFLVVLAMVMVPFQLFMIPLFLLMDKYNLIDTYAALILPGAVNSFSLFLMRQAFLTMPDDYIDAALIDGAGHFRILFQIGVPMVMPMLLTVALVNAFWSWNAFLWPYLVIAQESMATLPVALGRYSRMIVGGGRTIRWGDVMAAATLTGAPMIFIFLILQRRFVEALTMTGLKG